MRAFGLFFVAFIISLLLIFSRLGAPWSPSVPVVAYGLLLFYAQAWFYVALNGTIKDSPYFLGFTLTLVALLQVLSAIKPPVPGEPSISLTKEIGAAILTTVTGLFMRQLLLSRDPSEEAKDSVFQSLATEIRERTVDFHQSQKQFVALVQEFVSSRETLFSDEEKAFARYVERLEATGTRLGELEGQFFERTKSFAAAFDGMIDKLARTGEENVTKLLEVRLHLATQLKDEGESHRQALEVESSRVVTARTAFEKELQAVGQALTDSLPVFGERLRALQTVTAAFPDAATALANSTSTISKELSGLSEQMAKIKTHFKTVADDLAGEPTDIPKHLRSISADLKAVDEIVDQAVELLKKRVDLGRRDS
jgi:hypothetical protein